MTKEERQALRERAIEANKHTTHYQGCWAYHWTCAAIRVLDELEGLLEFVDWKAYAKNG